MEKPVQVGQVSKGGRGKKSGVSAASKMIGVHRQEAMRALKIDSRTPEAKEACREAGLSDNQTALLKVAAAEPERQVDVVRKIQEEKKRAADLDRREAQRHNADEVIAWLRDRLGGDFDAFRQMYSSVNRARFDDLLTSRETKAA